jgi:hypothetical protein
MWLEASERTLPSIDEALRLAPDYGDAAIPYAQVVPTTAQSAHPSAPGGCVL